MTFKRHNCTKKLDNGKTEEELKNYWPQIRELIEWTVPGAVAHSCQQKCLGLVTHKDAHCSIKLILSKHLKIAMNVNLSLTYQCLIYHGFLLHTFYLYIIQSITNTERIRNIWKIWIFKVSYSQALLNLSSQYNSIRLINKTRIQILILLVHQKDLFFLL